MATKPMVSSQNRGTNIPTDDAKGRMMAQLKASVSAGKEYEKKMERNMAMPKGGCKTC